jgi:hypothetical protein
MKRSNDGEQGGGSRQLLMHGFHVGASSSSAAAVLGEGAPTRKPEGHEYNAFDLFAKLTREGESGGGNDELSKILSHLSVKETRSLATLSHTAKNVMKKFLTHVILPLEGQDDLLLASKHTVKHVEWNGGVGDSPREWLVRFPRIKTLTFGPLFNQPLQEGDVPQGVETLTFGRDFNSSLLHMPDTVKTLKFGYRFNQPLDGISQGVETLTFGTYFDESLLHMPHTVKTLMFGYNFKQSLEGISPVVETLEFGYDFNQPLAHIPHTVKTLTFGSNFHQPLTYLPRTVTHLTVGHYFNHLLPTRPGLTIVRRSY